MPFLRRPASGLLLGVLALGGMGLLFTPTAAAQSGCIIACDKCTCDLKAYTCECTRCVFTKCKLLT